MRSIALFILNFRINKNSTNDKKSVVLRLVTDLNQQFVDKICYFIMRIFRTRSRVLNIIREIIYKKKMRAHEHLFYMY